MKHIFAFIDKLIILLSYVPKSLGGEEDKVKARKVVALIGEYTQILRKLIENHKGQEYLERLHQTHIKEIEDWVEQVASLFGKMDSLLIILDKESVILGSVIENEPENWQPTVSSLVLGMHMTGLHDEKEEMIRLRNIAIFEIHELEQIIDHKRHVEGLHRWNGFAELSEEEQIIEEEAFFVELFS